MSEWRVTKNEFEGCQGNGFLECLCGGDFCVCSNQGEVECIGCPDCKGYTATVKCANSACNNSHEVEVGDICPVCGLEATLF